MALFHYYSFCAIIEFYRFEAVSLLSEQAVFEDHLPPRVGMKFLDVKFFVVLGANVISPGTQTR